MLNAGHKRAADVEEALWKFFVEAGGFPNNVGKIMKIVARMGGAKPRVRLSPVALRGRFLATNNQQDMRCLVGISNTQVII